MSRTRYLLERLLNCILIVAYSYELAINYLSEQESANILFQSQNDVTHLQTKRLNSRYDIAVDIFDRKSRLERRLF